ncbi:MAG: hypothetical protein ACKV2Q_14215 [Planctomycetaceae bacterium]
MVLIHIGHALASVATSAPGRGVRRGAGDRLAQGQQPDRGFVLLAILAVERLEDFLRRLRRAVYLIEQGNRRRIQGVHGCGFWLRFIPEGSQPLAGG